MGNFTIRVYGILVRNGKLLVVDEEEYGKRFTKFPGGGLEWGEGTMSCLERELQEELSIRATDITHFYTSHFFVESAFAPGAQLLSVYYTFDTPDTFATSNIPFDFTHSPAGEKLCFRWLPLSNASENDMTFPIDKHVIGLIAKSY